MPKKRWLPEPRQERAKLLVTFQTTTVQDMANFAWEKWMQGIILQAIEGGPVTFDGIVDFARSNTTGRIGGMEEQRMKSYLDEFCDEGNIVQDGNKYRFPRAQPKSQYELGDVVRLKKDEIQVEGSQRRKVPSNPHALYLVVKLRDPSDKQSNPYLVVHLDGHSKGRSAYSIRHDQISGLIRQDPAHPWIWDEAHRLKFRLRVGTHVFDWTPHKEPAK